MSTREKLDAVKSIVNEANRLKDETIPMLSRDDWRRWTRRYFDYKHAADFLVAEQENLIIQLGEARCQQSPDSHILLKLHSIVVLLSEHQRLHERILPLLTEYDRDDCYASSNPIPMGLAKLRDLRCNLIVQLGKEELAKEFAR